MKKNLPLFFLLLFLMALMVFFPRISIECAVTAIESFFTIVFPSLFPFSVLASLLIGTGVLLKISAKLSPFLKKTIGFSGSFCFVFLSSCLSGYPMGAKLTCDLYEKGALSQKEASLLINATATSGPLFLSGALATGMLHNGQLSFYLLLPHYLSALLVALLNGRFAKKLPLPASFSKKQSPAEFFSLLSASLTSSLKGMATVLSLMVLFSCLCGVLSFLLPISNTLCLSLCSGIFEMTSGCLAASALPFKQALLLMSFLVGFSGFSVLFQISAFTAKAGIKQKGLIASKLLFAFLSVAFTYLLLRFVPLLPEDVVNVFSP